MRKKQKKRFRERHLSKAGICFEALEPRLLLSGSWGAVVDGPGADTQADSHGSLTQGSMVFHADTGITGVGSEDRSLTPGSSRVDLLSLAPAFNTPSNPVPALDASPASIPAAPVTDDTTAMALSDNKAAAPDPDPHADMLDAAMRRELVFVNDNVAAYEILINGIRESDTNRIVEIVVLDADRDGIQQVSDILAERSDLSAVHVIAHGSEGQISLGGSWLNSTTLQQNSDAVAGWGQALTETGDILFYGCNIATGGDGQGLVDDIARLTGADVAASDDNTGHISLSGDWELEHASGAIESVAAAHADAQGDWSHLLAAPSDLQATATTTGGLSLNEDGGNDAYLLADDGGAIFESLTELTIEAQFSATSAPTANYSDFVSYATSSQDEEVWLAFRRVSGTDFEIQFAVNGDIRTAAGYNAYSLFDGEQHALSVTWNSSGGAHEFFVDGASVYSNTGLKSGYTLQSGGELTLVRDQDTPGGDFDLGEVFQGTLHDLRIFDNVRSGAEIAANYRSTLPYDEPGLLANWTFDDFSLDATTGDRVVTDTVSGNNLTAMNVGAGGGYITSTPELTFAIDENSNTGTVVGTVLGTDPDRDATIAALLAADSELHYNAETGKFYKYTNNGFVLPAAAIAEAEGTMLNGINGQLVTIRSAYENEYVRIIAASYGSDVWLGGTDATVEGEWRWIESGSEADLFWSGDENGSAPSGVYQNWVSASQPNNTNGGEAFVRMDDDTGLWYDDEANARNVMVEWKADDVLDTTAPLTYSIQSQTVAGAFAIDADSGQITVADGSLLDYDTNAAHSVTVRVSDGSLTYEKAFTISLAQAVEFVVTNTNATGTGSLHEAILNANANVGVTDTITFNIGGGGPQTINVDAAGLPLITDSVILDATTQPGYSGTPLITLDGSATPASSGINGITLRTNDSTLKGFIVINFADEGIEVDGSTGFGDNNIIQNNWVGIDKDGNLAGNAEHGIMISDNATGNLIGGTGPNEGNVTASNGLSGIIINEDSDNNVVEGNIIGINPDGTTPAGNGTHGILIQLSSDGNRIGGTTAGAGNIIAGNTQDGIFVDGTTDATYTTIPTGTVIQGNWIGTTGTGSTGVGNGNAGINVEGANTIIGGTGVNDGNVITNNGNEGINVSGSGATGTIIQGNIIGLDPDGSTGSGNADVGIALLAGAHNTTIGGTTAAARNVISKNSEGIEVNSNNNVVQGNYIGTDAGGTLNRGNRSDDGVEIQGVASGNLIGGETAGAGNIIAFNALNGVNVVSGTNNAIVRNSIHSNTLLGINLSTSGVTANDSGDGDSGANNLQNFPVLTGAVTTGTQITITGTLNSTASTSFRIEFYSNATGDGTGYGEGQTLIGITDVTTDGSGNASFSPTFSETVSAGSAISAIVSRLDGADAETDTSEFAQNVIATVAANNAPVLDNNGVLTLTTITEDDAGNNGNLISEILASDIALPNPITDVDPAALEGIAIYNLDSSNGTWEYDIGGGWNPVGTVTWNSSLLLRDTDRLRFVPDGLNADLATVSFTAWDQTTGAAGTKVDTSTYDPTGAFSFNVEVATITVTAVNDDPINAGTLQSASVVTEDVSSTINLSAINLSDVDSAAGSLTMTLTTSTGGNLTAVAGTGITIGGNGTGVLTLMGNLTDLNAYLDAVGSVTYLHSVAHTSGFAADTIQVDVTDNGNTGSGGGGTITLGTFNVDITAVNDAPVITSPAAVSPAENQTTVATVTATDADGDIPTFSITGGADAALFDLGVNSGVLTFNAAPDFENPTDSDFDNVYEVEVTADDGNGGTDLQLITVTVTNRSDSAALWLSTDSNVAAPGADGLPGGWTESEVLEFSGPNLTHGTATDGELSRVIDFAAFTVDENDPGALHYVNRDITVGSGANCFDLQVGDVLVSFLQDETVLAAYTVSGSNELFEDDDLLVFRPTTPGDYTDGTFHLLLDGVVADDLKGVTLVEQDTIVGGTTIKAGSFFIIQEASATTSVDMFVATGVGEGTTTGTTTHLIDLSNLGIDADRLRGIELIEREITIGGQTLAEGAILATLNVDDDITGVGSNNLLVKNSDVFVLNLSATGLGTTAGTATMFLEGADVGLDGNPGEESPYALAMFNPVPLASTDPVITSGASVNVAENTTTVTTVTANDADGDSLTFAITGGADQSFFSIDSDSGVLTFDTAPDFETPIDFDANNNYEVEVTASDGIGGTVVQTIIVSVTDVNEAPTLVTLSSSTVDENIDTSSGYTVGLLTTTDQDAGDTTAYTINGGADNALFTIGGAGNDELILTDGILDFETQSSYEVTVRITDSGSLTHDQTFTISVNDLNEAPVITSPAAVNAAENQTGVTTVTATDADGDTPTFSITGGADSTLFSITAGGVLTFNSGQDFETFADADNNGIYEVEVTADDGNTGTDVQTILVTITDVNEAPTLVTLSSSTVDENIDTSSGYTVGLLTTTDQDAGDTTAYTINGGADNALFTIGGAGNDELILTDGILDFETQSSYEVTVRITDSGSLTHDQTFTISVNDLNEAPVITSPAAVNAAENQTGVTTVTATDADGDTPTFSITGGADSTLFSITAGGVLTFNSGQDFETFADADNNGIYEVEVTADDGNTGTDVQTILVTITDVNEAPTLVTLSSSTVDENIDTSSGYTVGLLTTTDQDAGDTTAYTINGGADNALFTIGGAGNDELILTDGILDFETQSSYEVTVRITDSGSLTHDQTFTISVNDLNEAPVITSPAAVNAAENQTGVTTVTATDADGDTPTFSITGGADSTLFSITAGGVLTFNSGQDFETFADADNNGIYEVEVTADDGNTGTDVQTILVTITDVNEAPTLVTLSSSTVDENIDTSSGYTVGLLTTTDQDAGDTTAYTINGGADNALFTIGGAGNDELILTDGILDFETQSSYEVTVRITDSGSLTHDQTFTISVNDLNEAPVITSPAAVNAAENQTGVTTVTATDADGDTPTFSITGGADSTLFSITAGGVLTFNSGQDFETFADADNNGIYEVEVTADDGNTGTDVQTILVTITDVNEAPTLVTLSSSTVDENIDTSSGYTVGLLTTTDQDAGDTTAYTINGGADNALFTIGGAGNDELILTDGILDFETQSSYEVTVRITDSGSLTHDQTFTISVNDLNEAPVITSPAAVNAAENQTGVTTVTATDADGDTPTFSITGGADSTLFSITAGGVLTFNSGQDFETFADADNNGIYEVEVTADDGNTGTDVQTILVTITDVNEAPTLVTLSSSTVDENIDTSSGYTVGLLTTTDQDAGDTTAYTINGGADNALFTIGGAGNDELILTDGILDFETQSSYEVTVRITDSGSLTHDQTFTISVNDLNEAPVITSPAAVNAAENQTGVTTVTATDADGDTPTFSITGGADSTLFSITAGGVLTFNSGQDFETFADADNNGIYEVEVTADDGNTGTDVQTILVTITDVNEAPTLVTLSSSTVDENIDTSSGYTVGLLTTTDQDAGDTTAYTINGGADNALFTIGGAGNDELILTDGILDFETQSSYEVTVRITDSGSLTHDQTFTISVNDLNEAPVITSPAAVNAAENQTGVTTVTATDADGDTPTFSITGGADSTLFSITAGGVLTFNSGQDFETFADADNNGIYEVEVTADDGNTGTDVQTILVTITDVNEAPTLVTLSSSTVDENIDTSSGYTVGLLTTTDQDAGDTTAYTINGGADNALFTIGGAGNDELILTDGILDFETQSSYEVTVRITDSGSLTHDQTFTISVNDLNEAPVITSPAAVNAAENQTGVTTVTATDADGDTPTFSITGGADSTLFSITAGGVLTFNSGQDFETFADADNNGIYEVEVTADDGNTGTDVQTILVTITDVNEAPTLVTLSSSTVDENIDTSSGYTVGLLTTTDQDAGDTTAYTINGGADNALFTIGGAGNDELILTDGILDFETQSSYEVTVRITDSGSLTHDQTFTISVNDLNEAPVITSPAAVNAAENQTGVTTVTATDADGDTPTFSITGGADSTLFSITAGGVLTFNSGQDFETFADADNNGIYEVEVTADDGNTGTDVQTILVTITDVNEAPTLVTLSSSTVDENIDTSSGYTVGLLTTTDQDAGDTTAYTINGGADNALFTIGGAGNDELILTDGILDFETQSSYEVTVRITDSGSLTHDQTFTISVNDLNEAPVITSPAAVNAAENQTGVTTVTATDADGDTPTFSITGGADSTLFSITAGGVLTFNSGQDFETFADADNNGIYEVEVTADDGNTGTDVQTILVTITDVNEAPTLVTLSSSTVDENIDTSSGYTVGLLTTTDQDAGDTTAYTINGGADNALFTIGGAGNDELILTDGILDFETQSSYEVTVRITDSGSLTHDQTFTISVNDLNEAPVITSPAAVNAAENQTGVTTVTATDADGDTPTFSITGGADSTLFSITAGGVLTFNSGQDFETFADADNNGIYEVEVTADDGNTGTDVQTILVTITDVNEAPTLVTLSSSTVDENIDTSSGYTVGLLTTTDQDAGDTTAYTINGGADNALFTIGGAGNDELILTDGILDFETQSSYEVTVRITDSGSLTHDQTFTISVNDLNEAPVITSPAAVNAAENQTGVTTVTATDADGDTPTFSITGGADSTLFSITAGGVLTFNSGQDFETFADADNNGIYEVEVTADDGNTGTDVQTILVTITDVNEAPTLVTLSSSTVDENIDTSSGYTVGLLTTTDQDAGDTTAYTINGGADNALFTIGGAGNDELILTDGILDFETQSSYEVTVRITDSGSLTHDQTFTISVNDLNEAPVITSPAAVNAAENQTGVTTVTATDADGDTPTFSITGGADSTLFSITAGGVLTFNSGQDFETFADADNNGIYEVEVTADDGNTGTDVQTILVTITDVNEAPTLVTLSSSTVDENIDTSSGYTVGLLTTTDQDAGDTTAYTINGGADNALFTIGGAGNDELILTDGILDFETQSSYEVTVRITDSGSLTHDQTFTISVNDLNEAPVITSPAAVNAAENQTGVTTVTATDADGDTPTFSITGGADSTLFSITAGGVLTFNSGQDFETFADADNNGIYEVEVTADDGNTGTDVQTILVTITDVNEAPTLVTLSSSTVDENIDTSSGYTVGLLTTTDQDAGDTTAYTINGGADNALFTIGGAGNDELILTDGILDFETQSSYEVTVRITDSGSLTHDQTFTISVNDLNEAPVITSPAAVNAAENQTGVTTVTATDADGDTPTFSITGGADSTLFSITAGGVLTFNSGQDFETFADADNNGIYEVEVTADDGNTGTDVQTILVTITDVNEAPTLVTLSSSTVDENIDTSSGYTVGLLTTTDQDAGDTTAYTINGGADNALFTIGGAGNDELILTDGILDFETQSSYEVTVRITDSGSLTHDQTFTITVGNTNDAPTVANAIPDQVATEDTPFTFTFAANTFADVDAGDILTYTSDASGWLSFDAATRTFSGTPANGDVGTVTVTVTADDGNGGTVSDTFDIVIGNANDAPTISGINTGAVTKNIDPDADELLEVGGVLTISDPDPAESSFQAGIVVGAYGSLTIDAAGNWNYAADNTQAVIQQMITGESISDVLTVTTADGTTHSVIVTINGATAVVGQSNGEPGPGFEIDPIEPDPEPEPELPPEEILPIEDGLPPREELAISDIPSSTLPVMTPLQWVDPTYFVPTISMLTTDNVLSTDDGSPSAVVSIVKRLQRELASQTIERVASKVSALFSADAMTQTLDLMHQQLGDTLEMDGKRGKLIIGAATGLGASVFAGYVIWAFRGSSLLLGALTAMPMWRCFDPLPVIMGDDKKRRDRDEAKSTENEFDKDETKVKELLGEERAAADTKSLNGRNS